MSFWSRIPCTVLAVAIADAVVHYSSAVLTRVLQEKTAYVFAVIAGAPGRLDAWVEISPDEITYVRLGAVQNLVATGQLVFPWTTHSSWMRIAVQAPLWAAGSWTVTAQFEGKT